MGQDRFDELLQFFKVLGNDSRLKILGLLANAERSVGELAGLLELTEPTVSHHLSLMKKLGLVRVRADGNIRYYRLDTAFLEQMNRDIFSRDNLATLVPDTELTPEEKVVQSYVQDGRLKDLPSKHQKRLIILEWVANQFEVGRKYEERELVAQLKEYHADHAALRRYLVDFGFMQRDRGIYWRVAPEPQQE